MARLTFVWVHKTGSAISNRVLWTYNNERPHTAIGGIPPVRLLDVAVAASC